jgi:hypothetical protein
VGVFVRKFWILKNFDGLKLEFFNLNFFRCWEWLFVMDFPTNFLNFKRKKIGAISRRGFSKSKNRFSLLIFHLPRLSNRFSSFFIFWKFGNFYFEFSQSLCKLENGANFFVSRFFNCGKFWEIFRSFRVIFF